MKRIHFLLFLFCIVCVNNLLAQPNSLSGIWINAKAVEGEISTIVLDLPMEYIHVFEKEAAGISDIRNERDLGVHKLALSTRRRNKEYSTEAGNKRIKVRKGSAGNLNVYIEDLRRQRSILGTRPTVFQPLDEDRSEGFIKFFNDTDQRADIYYDTGDRIMLMQQLSPKRSFEQPTWASMTWVALDKNLNLLKKVQNIDSYQYIYVDGSAKEIEQPQVIAIEEIGGIYINPNAKRGQLARIIVDGNQEVAEGFIRKEDTYRGIEVRTVGVSQLAKLNQSNLFARFPQHEVSLQALEESPQIGAEISVLNSRGLPEDKIQSNFDKLTFENADGVVEFFNMLQVPVDIYCQTEENMLFLMTLEPGASYRQPTLLDLKWVAKFGSQRLKEVASKKGVQQVYLRNEMASNQASNSLPGSGIPDYPSQPSQPYPENGSTGVNSEPISPESLGGTPEATQPQANVPTYPGTKPADPYPNSSPQANTPTYPGSASGNRPSYPINPGNTQPGQSQRPPVYPGQGNTTAQHMNQLDMSYLPRPLRSVKVLFGNSANQKLKLYVVGTNGMKYAFGDLKPGKVNRFDAYYGQKWEAFREDGSFYGAYVVSSEDNHRHIF